MNLTLTGALMHASPLRSFRLYSEEECVVVAAAVVDEDEDDAAWAMVDDVPPLLLLASSSCWLLTLLDVLLLVVPGSAEDEEEGASPSFATPPDMDVVGAENELDVEEEKEEEEEEDSPPPSAWLKACLTFAFQSSSPLSLDDSAGASWSEDDDSLFEGASPCAPVLWGIEMSSATKRHVQREREAAWRLKLLPTNIFGIPRAGVSSLCPPINKNKTHPQGVVMAWHRESLKCLRLPKLGWVWAEAGLKLSRAIFLHCEGREEKV